jgi:hypothetical protein
VSSRDPDSVVTGRPRANARWTEWWQSRFSADPMPLCDMDAPFDELVEGFRETLKLTPECSPLSAEDLARRWMLLRNGCDIWSGT